MFDSECCVKTLCHSVMYIHSSKFQVHCLTSCGITPATHLGVLLWKYLMSTSSHDISRFFFFLIKNFVMDQEAFVPSLPLPLGITSHTGAIICCTIPPLCAA